MASLPPRSAPILQRQSNRRTPNAEALHFIVFLVRVTFVLLLCGSSYLAGSIVGHNSSLDGTGMGVIRLIHGEANDRSGKQSGDDVDCKMTDEQLIELHVRQELERHKHRMERADSTSQTRRFPSNSMGKALNGMTRVKKDDINQYFDFGNPVARGEGTSVEDALVLYQKKQALPSSDEFLAHSAEYNDGMGIPLTDSETATENCDTMNIIFTGNPGSTRQCTAIIGNFESYHVQRWMKVDTTRTTPIKSELPLVPVSRGYGISRGGSKGKGNFYAPPSPSDGKLSPVKRHWSRLLPFFQTVDSTLEDLKTVLAKIARNNAVVVLTCNMGQSALLMNFACSARSRGFDLGNILVFPSDVETKEIAEGLGLTTYYDEKVGFWMPDTYFCAIPQLHRRIDTYNSASVFFTPTVFFFSIWCIWMTSRTWGNCPREKQGVTEVSVFILSHSNYLRSQIPHVEGFLFWRQDFHWWVRVII